LYVIAGCILLNVNAVICVQNYLTLPVIATCDYTARKYRRLVTLCNHKVMETLWWTSVPSRIPVHSWTLGAHAYCLHNRVITDMFFSLVIGSDGFLYVLLCLFNVAQRFTILRFYFRNGIINNSMELRPS
jgi:hypothetical protein